MALAIFIPTLGSLLTESFPWLAMMCCCCYFRYPPPSSPLKTTSVLALTNPVAGCFTHCWCACESIDFSAFRIFFRFAENCKLKTGLSSANFDWAASLFPTLNNQMQLSRQNSVNYPRLTRLSRSPTTLDWANWLIKNTTFQQLHFSPVIRSSLASYNRWSDTGVLILKTLPIYFSKLTFLKTPPASTGKSIRTVREP